MSIALGQLLDVVAWSVAIAGVVVVLLVLGAAVLHVAWLWQTRARR